MIVGELCRRHEGGADLAFEQCANRLLVISGPTACGKSDVAVRLARSIGGEIVSADSMQVYRGMDIGTAKPNQTERQGVPHHMIDIVDPWQNFSVAAYKDMAEQLIESAQAAGKRFILCGGSGLYISALIDSFDFNSSPSCPRTRQRIAEQLAEHGPAAMHFRLQQLDAQTASRIHANDARRIIRALEIYELRRRPTEPPSGRGHGRLRFGAEIFLLEMDRAELYERIEARVDDMLQKGLIDEVKDLLRLGVSLSATSMQALGYKEMADYLQGLCDLPTATALLKKRTRHYARRQIIWWRRESRAERLDMTRLSPQEAAKLIKEKSFER